MLVVFLDRVLTKPGVGEIRLRAGVFSKRVSSVWFVPEQRSTRYEVAVDAVEELMAAESLEQAMKVVRAHSV